MTAPRSACPGHETCGCCEPHVVTSFRNRAGLHEIQRRVAKYLDFKSATLRDVVTVADDIDVDSTLESRPRSQPRVDSPIRRWTTRTGDDIGNALIEAAAIELDVLTFYQERINQELYLRTAEQPDTIDALVSLIGYQPSPAVTASTFIAYNIEPDRTVTVPQWSRVQSVPQDGEVPQSFETTEELIAYGAASAIRPQPSTTPTTLRGRSAVLRVDSAGDLRRGDTVLAGPPNEAVERTVVSVVRDDDSAVVELDNDVELSASIAIWPIVARASAYGSDMPRTLDTSVIVESDSAANWAPTTLDRPPATGPNGDLLLSPPVELAADNVAVHSSGSGWNVSAVTSMTTSTHGTGPYERHVSAVQRASSGLGSTVVAPDRLSMFAEASGGRPQVSSVVFALPPRAATSQVQPLTRAFATAPAFAAGDTALLLGRAIPLARHERAHTLATGTSSLRFVDRAADLLDAGRRIAVRDSAGAFVSAVAEIRRQAGYTLVEFQPPLPRSFDAATTELLGNVAHARHGERSPGQVLGDGDPTLERQAFPLRRTPLAWHYDGSSPLGISPDIEVRAGGVRWEWVHQPSSEDATAPRYVVERDGDDSIVRVGSPAGGRPAPRGVRNLVADYRTGGGIDSNVAVGTITTALDRPPALRSIVNPVAADGGTDAETTENTRFAAPRSLRSFGRIISLPDLANAARTFPAVSKAASTWTWANGIQVLHLTVAGTNGAKLSDTTLLELRQFLDGQRDDRRPLRVDNHEPVMVELTVDVEVDDRAVIDHVAEEIRAALRTSFAFENLELGQSIDASTISMQLHRVEAVFGVRWTRLRRTTGGWDVPSTPTSRRGRFLLGNRRAVALPDPMPRVAIRGATQSGSFAVRPAELAVLELSPRDVRLRRAARPEVTT